MPELLGISLIVLASLLAPKAHGQTAPVASASAQLEPWQIVAEMQILHVMAATSTAEQTPPAIAEDASDDAQVPFQVAAAQIVHHTHTATASLPSDIGTASANSSFSIKVPEEVSATPVAPVAPALPVAAPAVRPPVPRERPLAAPPPAIVNSREDICNTLAASAAKHGLPVAFFGNLIFQESGLKPRVVSHVGARGIAQFMPGTARMVGLKNPFNPREALPASAKFLRSLLHQFGNNYGLAAAAYNAGPGKVSRWLKRRTVLPKETRDYVMTITGQHAEKWRGIRGNRFGHRLTQRMPCSSMPSFARINDPVFLEKDMVRKALTMLPRAPAPAAQVIPASLTIPSSQTPSDAIQKQEQRPASVNTQMIVASAVDDMALPRMNYSEQPTGAVTTVAKSEATPTAVKPSRSAALSEKPAAKVEAKKAEAKKAEARKTEAKLAVKKKAETKKIAATKAEVRKASAKFVDLKRIASARPPKEKDAWEEFYTPRKK